MSQKAAIVPSWHVFQLCLNTEPLTVTSYTCSFHIQLFVGECFFYDIFLKAILSGRIHSSKLRKGLMQLCDDKKICTLLLVSITALFSPYREKKNPNQQLISQNIPACKCFFFLNQSIIHACTL